MEAGGSGAEEGWMDGNLVVPTLPTHSHSSLACPENGGGMIYFPWALRYAQIFYHSNISPLLVFRGQCLGTALVFRDKHYIKIHQIHHR